MKKKELTKLTITVQDLENMLSAIYLGKSSEYKIRLETGEEMYGCQKCAFYGKEMCEYDYLAPPEHKSEHRYPVCIKIDGVLLKLTKELQYSAIYEKI